MGAEGDGIARANEYAPVDCGTEERFV